MRQEDEPGGGEPSGREPEGSGSDNRTDRRQKEKNSDAESEKFRKAQEKADRAGKKLHTARDKLDKAQAKQAAKKPPGLARKAAGEPGPRRGFTSTTKSIRWNRKMWAWREPINRS